MESGDTDLKAWGARGEMGRRSEIGLCRRLKAIRKCAAKNLLTHVNQYTGNCYCEDQCIPIYEIFNENGFAKYVLEAGGG